jgi:hypothetical protein
MDHQDLSSTPATIVDMSGRVEFGSGQRWVLLVILALVFVRGILYATVLPPWQHYDEPGHFEYVRLIAERHTLPKDGEYDLTMRRKIAASMRTADFWRDAEPPPAPERSDQPPSIGLGQLNHPPLYYLLQAFLQQFVAGAGMETQLYFARLVSVVLFVVTIAAAHGFVAEAFPGRRSLPIAVASFLALLPPLADLMSSVNSDVGAIAVTSLYLWAAVRLLRRGPSYGRVAATLILAGACFATKATAGLVAMTVLLVVAIALFPRRYRAWIWVGLALLFAVGAGLAFRWGVQAALWYSDDPPGAVTRTKSHAPLGQWAFLLSPGGQNQPRVLFQELPRATAQELQGHTVTVGGWIRVTEGDGSYAVLSLDDTVTLDWHRFEATPEWSFYAFTSTISVDAPGVSLSAIVPHRDAAREIYLDGLVLVDGEMHLSTPPEFDTAEGRSGRWGGQPFTNLLRNGSAETSWPSLRPRIATLIVFRSPANLVLHSLWDWIRTGWVYGPELSILFQSFWGRFGWNHVAVPEVLFYPLVLISVVSMLGAGLGLVRRARTGVPHRHERRYIGVILIATPLVSWGAAILRVHPVFVTRSVFWPVARYALVAIAPTATLLCLGLAEIIPVRWHKESAWVGLLGLITLDVIALWVAILPYYYG